MIEAKIALAFATALLLSQPTWASDQTWLLEIQWPHIGRQTFAATTRASCLDGANAALKGLLVEARIGEVGHKTPALLARCVPGNQFPKGWDCIRGFNCKTEK